MTASPHSLWTCFPGDDVEGAFQLVLQLERPARHRDQLDRVSGLPQRELAMRAPDEDSAHSRFVLTFSINSSWMIAA